MERYVRWVRQSGRRRDVELIGALGSGRPPGGLPLLGGLQDLERVWDECAVDEVVLALPERESGQARALAALCQRDGRSFSVMSETPETALVPAAGAGRVRVTRMGPFTLTTWEYPGHSRIGKRFKRLVDVVGAAAGLVLLSPLLLAIAVAIRLTSPGPALFRQERIGLNGRRFHVYKFRTMVADADLQKERLRHLNEVDGPVFKIRDDPRVTPIGRFLRRTSLDELPQLINVLNGEMSLVGPRPLPTREALECRGRHRRRTAVPPGLTCTWQVSGRNAIPFDRWMEMDIDYIESWSLWRDAALLMRTAREVLRMGGM